MNNENYSESLKQVFANADKLAEIFKSSYMGSEHLVFAMLNLPECAAYKILSTQGITAEEWEDYFARTIDTMSNIKGFTPRTQLMIQKATELSNHVTRTDHLLAAIMSFDDCIAMRTLRCIGANLYELAMGIELSINEEVEE